MRHSLAARGIKTVTQQSGLRSNRSYINNRATMKRKLREQLGTYGMPVRTRLEYDGLVYDGEINFELIDGDDTSFEVLAAIRKLDGRRTVPLSDVKSYIRTGEKVVQFAAEPDKRSTLAEIAGSLARAGLCILVTIAAKQAVAWIAAAAGGPLGLVLTVALMAASSLIRV